MQKLFYPKWWLDVTGFWNNKPNTGDDVIMFATGPTTGYNGGYMISQSTLMGSLLITGIISSVLTLLVTALVIRHRNKNGTQKYDYISINL